MSSEKEQAVMAEHFAPAAIPAAPLQGQDAANSSAQPTNGPSPSLPGKLIQLADHERGLLLARDINAKIDDLEKHFEQLQGHFAKSQQSFKTTLADLLSRNAKMAADIENTAERLEQSNESHSQVTDALDQRMRTEMSTLNQQLGSAAESLQAQQAQLQQLQANQRTLASLQERFGTLAEKQGMAIEALNEEARNQFHHNKAQFEGVNALQRELQTALNLLLENHVNLDGKHQVLEEKTAGIAEQVGALETDAAAHKQQTKTNFRMVAGGFAGVVVVVAALSTYFQFYPTAVPAVVKTQLASLNAEFNQQSQVLTGLFSSLGEVRDQVASLASSVTQNSKDTAALRTDFGQTSEQVMALRADLGALQKHVDNLSYRVEGPTNQGAGSLVPALPLHDAQWIASQDASHYSIQLVGVYSKQQLVAYVNQSAKSFGEQPLFFTQGKHLGRDWFNLYYGDFASFDAAQKSLQGLPLRLRGNNPWVRSMAAIQKVAG